MNRDDVIRMAREAGMEQDGDNFFSPSHEEIDVHITDLERFAALVAAAEREECAQVCDNIAANHSLHDSNVSAGAAEDCAELIRARGQA